MSFLADRPCNARSEPSADDTSFCVDDGDPRCVAPDTQYVRVWLSGAHRTAVRRRSTRYVRAVHARFTCVDHSAGLTEVMRVVSPGQAFEALAPRHLGRGVGANLPRFGPLRCCGGLPMEVARLGIAGADLAQPCLELLSPPTEGAGVIFPGNVKPCVDPIRRGAELLFKGDDTQFEAGMQRADLPLRAGSTQSRRHSRPPVGGSKRAALEHHRRGCQ